MTYSKAFRLSCISQVATLVGQASSPSLVKIYQIIAHVASQNPPVSGSTLRKWVESQASSTDEARSRDERKRKRELDKVSERSAKGDVYTHEHISYVKDLLSESPGLKDQELALCVYLTYGVFFPPSKIHETLHREGWTNKVMGHFAIEMNSELVVAWQHLVQSLDATMFVYGDGKHLNGKDCERKKGRAPKGVRAIQKKKLKRLMLVLHKADVVPYSRFLWKAP